MGTKVPTRAPLAPTPLVQIKDQPGQVFIGRLIDKRDADTMYGEKTVYEFELIESTMLFVVKTGEEYVEAKVEPGTKVSIFAPTRLSYALEQVEQNKVVKITYLGRDQKQRRGQKAHDYEVEVID